MSIFCNKPFTADVRGTVMCDEAVASPSEFKVDFWRLVARYFDASLGSFGVGSQRSGFAICASRVSNGNKEAFGRPADSCYPCVTRYDMGAMRMPKLHPQLQRLWDAPPAKFAIPGIWKNL